MLNVVRVWGEYAPHEDPVPTQGLPSAGWNPPPPQEERRHQVSHTALGMPPERRGQGARSLFDPRRTDDGEAG